MTNPSTASTTRTREISLQHHEQGQLARIRQRLFQLREREGLAKSRWQLAAETTTETPTKQERVVRCPHCGETLERIVS
jgi:uncharacterized Zn finger protein